MINIPKDIQIIKTKLRNNYDNINKNKHKIKLIEIPYVENAIKHRKNK